MFDYMEYINMCFDEEGLLDQQAHIIRKPTAGIRQASMHRQFLSYAKLIVNVNVDVSAHVQEVVEGGGLYVGGWWWLGVGDEYSQ